MIMMSSLSKNGSHIRIERLSFACADASRAIYQRLRQGSRNELEASPAESSGGEPGSRAWLAVPGEGRNSPSGPAIGESWLAFFHRFLIGITSSALAIKYRSLLPSFTLHATVNGIACIAAMAE